MKKTKGERRIAILKDVLQQLKLEKFKATNGTYVSLPKILREKTYEEPELDAKTALLNCQGSCSVCAKGSIFLSQVRKENQVKLEELDWDMEDASNKATKRVVNLFGGNNLNRIEAAFERWPYITEQYEDEVFINYTSDSTHTKWNEFSGYYETINNKRDEKIVKFYNRYPDKTDRLKAIVRNAIKNNGIFKP
jgi:hypothetical protein